MRVQDKTKLSFVCLMVFAMFSFLLVGCSKSDSNQSTTDDDYIKTDTEQVDDTQDYNNTVDETDETPDEDNIEPDDNKVDEDNNPFTLEASVECYQHDSHLNKQDCGIETNAEEIKNITITYDKFVPEESEAQWKQVTEELNTTDLNAILDQYVAGTIANFELEDMYGNKVNFDSEELDGSYEKPMFNRIDGSGIIVYDNEAGKTVLFQMLRGSPTMPDGYKTKIEVWDSENIPELEEGGFSDGDLLTVEPITEPITDAYIQTAACVDYNGNKIQDPEETNCLVTEKYL